MEGVEEYILVGKRVDGILTDIRWRFNNPYHAGEMVGLLVHMMAENFKRNNPNEKQDPYTLILEGILTARHGAIEASIGIDEEGERNVQAGTH